MSRALALLCVSTGLRSVSSCLALYAFQSFMQQLQVSAAALPRHVYSAWQESGQSIHVHCYSRPHERRSYGASTAWWGASVACQG